MDLEKSFCMYKYCCYILLYRDLMDLVVPAYRMSQSSITIRDDSFCLFLFFLLKIWTTRGYCIARVCPDRSSGGRISLFTHEMIWKCLLREKFDGIVLWATELNNQKWTVDMIGNIIRSLTEAPSTACNSATHNHNASQPKCKRRILRSCRERWTGSASALSKSSRAMKGTVPVRWWAALTAS